MPLAKFIAEGCLLKHIRRCHTVYAGRREALAERAQTIQTRWGLPAPKWLRVFKPVLSI